MSLSRKSKILIGGALAAIIITVAVTGYIVYSAYSFLNQFGTFSKKEIPAILQETKVFTGGEFLTKTEVFKLKPLSRSEMISRSLTISDEKARQQFVSSETAKGIFKFDDLRICGDEIIAVGKFGGYVFEQSGELKREIYFEPTERTTKIGWYSQKEYKADLDNLKIIELDNKRKCGFLSHGYREGVNVYDLKGKRIWNYGEETVDDLGKMLSETDEDADKRVYITEASAGDLDGDGLAEFIVSRKNDGIHAFDQNNNEKWFQPDEFPTADFRFIDVNGDGTSELIEFQGKGSTIRNKKTGEILEKLDIDGWRKDFLIFEDVKKKKSVQMFQIDDNKLSISDLSNKVLLTAEAPLSEIKIAPIKYDLPSPSPIPGNDGLVAKPIDSTYFKDSETVSKAKAVWVNLQPGKSKYLAIIASFISLPRSNFYVYDEKGTLIYHELLPEDAETIAVVPSANSAEEILIGGKDTIWKFTAK